jgi:pyridoxamine 5'-phosphate oxidase
VEATLAEVDAAGRDLDPRAVVAAWLADARAAGIENAEAMALATASPDGAPSVRMVLLKGCDERGLVFYTNTESRKAAELAANPRAAVALYWQPLNRQVRAEGRVVTLPGDETQAYFDTRPRGSRLAAWASPQSAVLEDRAALERLLAEAEARFEGVERPPVPPHWGGYVLDPAAIELWEGRLDRLHDRLRYERRGAGWAVSRLAP